MKPVYRSLRSFLRLALFAACSVFLSVAHAACEDRFFAPEDNDNARPLTRPHPDFIATLRAANAGNARESRNVAVSYEAGYLVSRCPEKAAYWYAKAAHGGDDVAKRWMEEREALDRLADGPECIGLYCSRNPDGRSHVAMFYAGHNGHYFAPLTINGITVTGLIDTGASSIAISHETARKFGIDKLPGKQGTGQTANGTVTTNNVIVPSVTVSGITLENVSVAIGITGEPLIGMSFLSRLQLRMGSGALAMSR